MVNGLRARGLRPPAMQDALKRTNGDPTPITDVPDDLKAVYQTVRFIPPQRPEEAADRRGPVAWTGAPGQLHPDWFGPGLISWRRQSLFQTAASRLLATPTLGMGPGAAGCGQCARDRHVVGGVASVDAAGILAEGHAGRRRRSPHTGLVLDGSDCGRVSITIPSGIRAGTSAASPAGPSAPVVSASATTTPVPNPAAAASPATPSRPPRRRGDILLIAQNRDGWQDILAWCPANSPTGIECLENGVPKRIWPRMNCFADLPTSWHPADRGTAFTVGCGGGGSSRLSPSASAPATVCAPCPTRP